MRAVILEVDEGMLAERRRLGLDHGDEMWEGVLYMVPPPSTRHGEIQAALSAALRPVARRHGLRIGTQVGVFAAGDDYRVPDLTVFKPDAASERGVEGAPVLVVEIRSPGDESDAKVPWYLGRGAGAVLIVDRDTLALDLHAAGGRTPPEADGLIPVPALGVRIGSGAEEFVVEADGRTTTIEV